MSYVIRSLRAAALRGGAKGNPASNGKQKGEGNIRNGNKHLVWAFGEAAHFALRFCPEAKRFYDRKKAKTNNIVATKALAHKLARACFHMLKEYKPFDVPRCFA